MSRPDTARLDTAHLDTDDDVAALSTSQATLLVAEREITTQVRSKSFIISVLVTVLLIAGGIILMNVFGGGDDAADVAVVEGAEVPEQAGEAPGPLGTALEQQEVSSMDEAEELLRDGEVEAIVAPDDSSPVGLTLIGLDSPPTEVAQSLSVMPTMQTLEASDTDSALGFLVAMGFGLVFMILAMGSGSTIVQNTVQEKQSRIVEILLSSISSRALLAGKVLGNSALAVGQALLYATAASAALLITGQESVLDTLTLPMLWFVLFFVPGFLLVAAMFAAGASLVSRQEDVGAVMTPTMMLVMAPYFLVIFLQDNPLAMTIGSYVPFSAPVAMPVRMFLGEAQWFEPVVAMVLLVAAVAVMMALAARIYSRSLLHMGQRMKLRAALSSRD
ncbi:MAG: ABC transporter permease [Nesterenkonia sp.]|nr:ABC transporter permease [Nesterenkonia sp.]